MKKIMIVMLLSITSMMATGVMAATLSLSIPSQPALPGFNFQTVNQASGSTVSGGGGFSTNDGTGFHTTENHIFNIVADVKTKLVSLIIAHTRFSPHPLQYVELHKIGGGIVTTGSLIAGTKNYSLSGIISGLPALYALHIGVKGEGTYDVSIKATPIPAAVWLFGSGFLGLIGFARRKTKTLVAV